MYDMQVLKFGGSSVADATNISRVLDIVAGAALGGRVILVCSAIAGCTDALLEIARSEGAVRDTLISSLRQRHRDIITRLFTGAEREEALAENDSLFEAMAAAPADETVTFGELFSTKIIARKLACDGIATKWLDSRILVIKGNKELTYNNISTAVALEPAVRVFVAPGFIASEYGGKHTTLGRGGSDLSAALYAAASKADRLEIWTDVPGIMTANPKTVPAAVTVPRMSWKAAADMASHGAKVLYAPTVEPAREAGIPIHILNTFEPSNPGTVVCSDVQESGWVGVTGMQDSVKGESLICLVSEGGINGEAACARVEDCLKKAGVRTLAISSDGTNVYATVRLAVEEQALGAIHREFFESAPRTVLNVYIAGRGAVGKALEEMIKESAGTIAERTGKILGIEGVSNSKDYTLVNQPGPFSAAGNAFVKAVIENAPRGSIFVDVTNSPDIWRCYESLLRAGINIVTSNRRSLAVPYVDYAAMIAAAQENGVFLRHETTVGSALPILESIAAGANTGDELVSIEAVVSCTLNRILTEYTLTPCTFAQIVRKAQDEGLTEPDPRVDLSGKEALRKLLILAREAGVPLEEEDVQIESVIGPEFFDIPLDEFYRKLEAAEPQIRAREDAADAKRCRQRFVASLVKDPESPHGYRASIKVQDVDASHPAYRLKGTENAIIIRSTYHPYPLLIQGPGEGARLAASSVLNDILR